MAGVQVKRPKAIVFDILGTASKSGFLEKILFPYLKKHLDEYLTAHWNEKDTSILYEKIKEHSILNQQKDSTAPVMPSFSASNAKDALVTFMDYATETGIDTPAVMNLRFRVWFDGYEARKIHTPIYRDFPNKMKLWAGQGIKFYTYSNTWVTAQKALLRNTNHGDLTNLISGNFDAEFGLLTESESWRRMCLNIGEPANNVLFLTKSLAEGKAAAMAGVHVVLVLTHRHNVKAIPAEERGRFPIVRTLDDLSWTDQLAPGGPPSVAEHSGGAKNSASEAPAAIMAAPTAVSASSAQASTSSAAASSTEPSASAAASAEPASSASASAAPSRSSSKKHSGKSRSKAKK